MIFQLIYFYLVCILMGGSGKHNFRKPQKTIPSHLIINQLSTTTIKEETTTEPPITCANFNSCESCLSGVENLVCGWESEFGDGNVGVCRATQKGGEYETIWITTVDSCSGPSTMPSTDNEIYYEFQSQPSSSTLLPQSLKNETDFPPQLIMLEEESNETLPEILTTKIMPTTTENVDTTKEETTSGFTTETTGIPSETEITSVVTPSKEEPVISTMGPLIESSIKPPLNQGEKVPNLPDENPTDLSWKTRLSLYVGASGAIALAVYTFHQWLNRETGGSGISCI